jgi:hypothetical protein
MKTLRISAAIIRNCSARRRDRDVARGGAVILKCKNAPIEIIARCDSVYFTFSAFPFSFSF